ncbi:Gfo/Idh/MocA family oxidoreductase [Fictibacillus enclensis]|uniref:Gfo/Idh/MocA family protein n=1 Tax=Fictibacillus enclensis TaxID=1017270 RepID=UPI0025A00C1C|nr:Gfo/Idh/MocA family oxidoreductase [Fictibacillus enclensis]MDM5201008.1 Gfo/Idh/MocA family oxidoreductase [Fictibacillus enclensis]
MINFAIAGCGRVAAVHAEAIQQAQGAKLLAVCDINEERLYPFAQNYGAESAFTDFRAMINNPAIDVVNICTPNALHAEMAIQAMEKGKHVMIEKPMALSIRDADRIIETAKKHHVKATVVHQNRFNEAVQTTRKALEEGKFGKMAYGTANIRWRRGKEYYDQDAWRGTAAMKDGVLMNQCIHTIDLLIWLMGPVKSVMGKTATRTVDIEMEDIGTALLEFQSGSIGVVEGTGAIYPADLGASLNLFGENGTVCIGGNAANQIEKWRFSTSFHEEESKMVSDQSNLPDSVYGEGHKTIVTDFIRAIQTDTEPYVSLKDGRNAIQVILAIYESSKTGKAVELRAQQDMKKNSLLSG